MPQSNSNWSEQKIKNIPNSKSANTLEKVCQINIRIFELKFNKVKFLQILFNWIDKEGQEDIV